MCGRFVSINDENKIKKIFDIKKTINFSEKSFNISPEQKINLIYKHKENFILDSFKWGYSFYNKYFNKNQLVINSRLETINTKILFKESYIKRKCIILSNGYFEWKVEEKEKFPYYIHIPYQEPIYFAGIWRVEKKDNIQIHVCNILTKEANYKIKNIHNRMPVVFSISEAISYLNHKEDKYKDSLIRSEIEEEIDFYKISKKINNPKNNCKECLFPLN